LFVLHCSQESLYIKWSTNKTKDNKIYNFTKFHNNELWGWEIQNVIENLSNFPQIEWTFLNGYTLSRQKVCIT